LKAISPGLDFLKRLEEAAQVLVTITLSAWVPGHPLAYVPNSYIHIDLIRKIAAIGADLQFDINLLAEDEPTESQGDRVLQ
jgi:hypothetical protein